MVTTTPSTPPLAGEPPVPHPAQAAWKAAVQVPTPASTEAGGTGGSPTCTAAFQAARSVSTEVGTTSVPSLTPWRRVDAAWPTIANSPSGLDGEAQRLVRRLLTQAAGKRLARRRELETARLWMWKPQPHVADAARQRRFYAPGLWRFQPLDVWDLLRQEAALALEIVATPPGALGAGVWQELLEVQCQRIGQLHAELQRRLGAARARATLQGVLEALI